MTIKFNEKLLMWGLGVIQPACPTEVKEFLRIVYPTVHQWPNSSSLNDVFEKWVEKKYVVRLNKKHQVYSLTALANIHMDVKLKRQRDKARITLLREVYDATVKMSDCVVKDLDGDSPSSEGSVVKQEGTRPVIAGTAPSRLKSTRHSASNYWPRGCEQLSYKVGLGFHASDIPLYRYRYCSFPNLKTLHSASLDKPLERDMSISQLALAIGVTPRLLTSLTHKKSNHYRTFTIGKKGGGKREIASPRYFLKTIQYWIKSYILCHLNVHNSCHAFLRNRSIISNASEHVNKNYVANIDIENYFGSIDKKMIFHVLRSNGIGEKLSHAVSELVSFQGSLPQGAPTSPQISNAFLYDFDEDLSQKAGVLDATYTRYADDITISGDSKSSVLKLIDQAKILLNKNGLKVNEKKTRIASYYSSQRVTGLAVNEKVQPPRKYRRKIRAIFDQAGKNPPEFLDRTEELRGYIGYLSAFDVPEINKSLLDYRIIVKKIGQLTSSL